jgi:hypothetical protein
MEDVKVVWHPEKVGIELSVDGNLISKYHLQSGVEKIFRGIKSQLQQMLFGISETKFLDLIQTFKKNGPISNQFQYESVFDVPELQSIQKAFIYDLKKCTLFKERCLHRTSSGISFKQQALKDYLCQCENIVKKFLTAIHVTSGQPARATELESLLLRSRNGFPNNLWYLNGHLVTVTYYNKTNAILLKERPIVRCLPEILSDYLLIYLICIREIEQ